MHRASTALSPAAVVEKARAVNSQCDWANSAKRSSTSSDDDVDDDSFVDETVGETTTSDRLPSSSSVAKAAGCLQEEEEVEEPPPRRRRRHEALARTRRGAMGARVVTLVVVVVALVRVDVAIGMYRSYRGKGDQNRPGVREWVDKNDDDKKKQGAPVRVAFAFFSCHVVRVTNRQCVPTVPLTLPCL